MAVSGWLAALRPRRRKKPFRRPESDRFSAQLIIKPLEARTLLSASTLLTLNGTGNLLISDVGGNNDQITMTSDPKSGTIIISDPTNTLDASGVAGAQVSNGGHTVTISASVVTSITTDLGAGDDSLTVDLSAGDFGAQGKPVFYNSGPGNDSLTVIAPPGADILTLGAGTALDNQLTRTTANSTGSTIEFDSVANFTVSGGNDDKIVVDQTVTVTGSTTLNAGQIQLNANLTGNVTGSSATVIGVNTGGEIQDGVNLAADGGTVTVASGTYNGDVVIDRALTLNGFYSTSPPTSTIARGVNESVINGNIQVVASGDVVITGLFINGGISDPGADLLIENDIIIASGTAIDISGANSATIQNNAISAGGDGIFGVGVSSDVLIQDNLIAAANYGVYVHQLGGSVTAQRNRITDFAAVGIEVAEVNDDVELFDNYIQSAVAGSQGIYVSNLNYTSPAATTIQGNKVYVRGTGVWVESVQGAIQIGGSGVMGNEIGDVTNGPVTIGVRIDGSSVAGVSVVENNQIASSGSGIEFREGVNDFTARGNTIKAGFEAGILVNNSTAGNILIANNSVEVTNAAAAIEVTFVTGDVTIQDNSKIKSDFSATYTVQVENVGGKVEFLRNTNVTTSSIGLYVNNIGGAVTVQGSNFSGDGILGLQVSNSGPVTIDTNSVTGLILGINVSDSPTAEIENNTVTGSIRGIYVATVAQLDYTGNSITSAAGGTGLALDGRFGPLVVTFGSGNVITGGAIGITMQGAGVQVANTGTVASPIYTLNNLKLTGQSSSYIVLSEGALAGQEVDGTGVEYDGLVGQSITNRTQGFAIENKITHAIDDGSLGFIRVQHGSVFITSSSFVTPATTTPSIQRGINVAIANDKIYVQAGTYTGNLVIDKPLSLIGPNDGISAVTGTRQPEAVITGDTLIVTPGSVTITGFNITGSIANDVPASQANGGPNLLITDNFLTAVGDAIDASSTSSAIIQDNVIVAGGIAVLAIEVAGAFTVERNNITSSGSSGVEGRLIGGSATLRSNSITLNNAAGAGIALSDITGDLIVGGAAVADGNIIGGSLSNGIIATGIGGTVDVSHNQVTGVAETGISIVNFVGNATVIANSVTSTLVGGSPVQGIYLSNLTQPSNASVRLQSNLVKVEGGGVWLERIGGSITIGGAALGEENNITSAGGFGVRIDAYSAGGPAAPVNITRNKIKAGGSGVEYRDGASDVTIDGNTIEAGFEAGILVTNTSDGNLLINNNTVNVTNAAAAISATQIAKNVTITNNSQIKSDFSAAFTVDVEYIGGNLVFVNNGVTTDSIGLYGNNIVGTVRVQSNTFGGTGVLGMQISNAGGAVTIGGSLASQGNTITNLILGINVTDSPSAQIENNSVSGAVRGVYVATVGQVTYTKNTITSAAGGTGLSLDGRFAPMKVTFGADNTITGGAIGISMQGAGVQVANTGTLASPVYTLNNLILTGQTSAYIVLSEGALAGQEVNGTGVKYDGILGQAVTRAQGFTIEDKITHAIDDGTLGFIRVQTGSVFVTPNSFVAPNTTQPSIQRGINVAVANDTVYVQAGTYLGNLLIDKPLTLRGPNDGISAVTGTRVTEAFITGDTTIAAPGNVTIIGFTITGAIANDTLAAQTNGKPNLVIADNFITAAGTALDASFTNSLAVTDNKITGGGDGVYAFNVTGPVTVQGNRVSAGDRGIALDQITGPVQIGGATAAVQNTIDAVTYGVFAHNLASTFTAQGNKVTGFANVGMEVAAVDGNVTVIGNQLNSTVAGSQGLYVSNQGHVSSASATVQGNTIAVNGLGIWLESLRGVQQIGGTGSGQGNTVTAASGVGVRIDDAFATAPTNLINNQITAGSSGVEYRNGRADFNVKGNTITAGFEAGLLVSNSTAGNIIIGGLGASDGNTITVTNAVAGIELLGIAGNLVLQNNHVTSDSSGIVGNNIGGTATIQRNLLDGSGLFGMDLSGIAGTVTVGGLKSVGSVSISGQNAMNVLPEAGYLTTGIDAGASTITLKANQDGVGSEGFIQNTAAPIKTTNATDLAIVINVGGNGSAAISTLFADTATGQITVGAGGAIIDNSADAPADITNIEAERALLNAGTGIGGNGNADIDTAVSSLRAYSATGNIIIQERDDIELRSVIAATGAININAGGILTVQNHTAAEGATLQSATGAVSNAPPLVRLDEQNPNDVILPADRTQEVVGTYGGIPPADNLEQGANFTASVTWADGKTNTVHGLHAGDTLVWYIDENGNGTPQITHNATGTGPITVFIQRTYPFPFLQTIQGTDVAAAFTLANDPNIVLTDSQYPSTTVFTNLNATAPLIILTTLSKTEFQPPIMYVPEPPAPAVETPPPLTVIEHSIGNPITVNRYQMTTLVQDDAVEQQAILYLVRVGPNGEEEQRVQLPLSDLQNIAGLLDRLRKLKMRSGLYRIYHQEPGLPPRKVLEFRKAGNFIGDPVREPGRGANPVEEQPGEAPAPKEDAPKPPAVPPAADERNAALPSPASQVALAIAEATPSSFTKAARLRRALAAAAR